MAPLKLEAGLLRIVRHALVAVLGVLVTEEETAAVTVALAVVRGHAYAPRALGVYLAEQLEVPLVAHGEVVSAVAQVESARALVAVAWHDEAARIALGEREEAVRDGQRQRYVGHNEIGGTEHDILTRPYLGAGEGYVEVWVLLVARSITAMLKVKHAA